ncbi:NAD(P)-binding protein [Fistulina hepatica ATCC 64428]|uniref:NAD(P)-binding protein n=1 Tax=Fistulina hepatica ATCC 64428 TaxID=1128425 RepID=A0A0D7A4J9_9AGAR|nr:NAD(P)-binding protein [Fistulina hepatica ATCC 64428]
MLAARLNDALRRTGQRAYHDVATLPSKRVVVSQGPPGYSAVSGHVATVFGCTGFLGRYVVSKLGKIGTQVVVPYRDEDKKRFLKPMGDLGQIVPLEWDIRNESQIAECLRHSDIVYNVVGRDYATKNFDLHSVHVEGAERIARIAAECGVERFVHVSHLNASADSSSVFYQFKAEGEARVKAAFPSAVIVRPAAMFGYEDKLLNNIPIWPSFWKYNYGAATMRPVHVFDVAQALANLIHSSGLEGETFNLPGPSRLSQEFLLDLVSSVTYRPLQSAPSLPIGLSKAVAGIVEKAVWWPTLSPDEIERRLVSDVDVSGDWEKVGVIPDEIETHAIKYLRRYRSADNFVRPVVFPQRPASSEA